MPENVQHERPPLVFPIVLIVVGALFLYANYRPSFDPWYVMKTYWPLILIFVGLAKIFDSTRLRRAGASGTDAWSVGSTLGAVAFIVVVVILLFHSHALSHNRAFRSNVKHESQHIDLQGRLRHPQLLHVVANTCGRPARSVPVTFDESVFERFHLRGLRLLDRALRLQGIRQLRIHLRSLLVLQM